MSIFMRNMPSEHWIIAPRALYPASPSGFSWRAPAPRGSWPSVDLFRPAIEKLILMLDRWANVNELDVTDFDVAGFSQGGAMTFTLGTLYPGRVRKMGILAGFAPEGAEQILTPDLFRGKNIFLAHGTLDEMVPVAMAHRTVQLLRNSGALVTYCESAVGHKLSADCLRALENYLAD
jgi:phospholipase/carboxylesterase